MPDAWVDINAATRSVDELRSDLRDV